MSSFWAGFPGPSEPQTGYRNPTRRSLGDAPPFSLRTRSRIFCSRAVFAPLHWARDGHGTSTCICWPESARLEALGWIPLTLSCIASESRAGEGGPSWRTGGFWQVSIFISVRHRIRSPRWLADAGGGARYGFGRSSRLECCFAPVMLCQPTIRRSASRLGLRPDSAVELWPEGNCPTSGGRI
jgi:hypothetical protein